jgi:hypothetical protein
MISALHSVQFLQDAITVSIHTQDRPRFVCMWAIHDQLYSQALPDLEQPAPASTLVMSSTLMPASGSFSFTSFDLPSCVAIPRAHVRRVG